MYKLVAYALFVFILILGCKKEVPQISSPLVGEWVITSKSGTQTAPVQDPIPISPFFERRLELKIKLDMTFEQYQDVAPPAMVTFIWSQGTYIVTSDRLTFNYTSVGHKPLAFSYTLAGKNDLTLVNRTEVTRDGIMYQQVVTSTYVRFK